MKKVTEIVAELAAPVAAEFGCELWDVEYVREAGQWYLRLYLDKEGGVDILDCENVSRKVSDLLDEVDPIEASYIFEVSSAGAERASAPGILSDSWALPCCSRRTKTATGARSLPGRSPATTGARCCSTWAARSRSGLKSRKLRSCVCVLCFKRSVL